MNGNSWAGELYRQHSLIVCVCVYDCTCVRQRERERDSGGAATRAVSLGNLSEELTAVLSSSTTGLFSVSSAFWFFFILRLALWISPSSWKSLQRCRDSPAATAREGESRRKKRERERSQDRPIDYTETEKRGTRREETCIFLIAFCLKRRLSLTCTGVLWSIWFMSVLWKVSPAHWRDSWCSFGHIKDFPSLPSSAQQPTFGTSEKPLLKEKFNVYKIIDLHSDILNDNAGHQPVSVFWTLPTGLSSNGRRHGEGRTDDGSWQTCLSQPERRWAK